MAEEWMSHLHYMAVMAEYMTTPQDDGLSSTSCGFHPVTIHRICSSHT